MKNANIELVLSIFGVIKQNIPSQSQAKNALDLINELQNSLDSNGMRPMDLLAFRIDDDQKNFIKEFHCEEKNFKVAKTFELYTWGRSNNFNLGYAQVADEKLKPKKVEFPLKNISLKQIKLGNTYSLAISEEG